MFFKNIENLEQLKKEYKRLAFIYHPDRGGDTATMQDLNNAYDTLFNRFKNNDQHNNNSTDSHEAASDFKDIISKLIGLDGIDVEICGNWIWLSGDTKQHKDVLKEACCRWASKKKMWYWRSEEYAVKGKSNLSIDQIRGKYGSERIKSSYKPTLAS